MKNSTADRKVNVLLWLFLISSAALRALNVIKANLYSSDGKTTLYSVLDVSLGIIVIFTYALALCAIVLASLKSTGKKAFSAASAACAVILADRAFCLLWDLSSSNISLGEKGVFLDAASWLAVDFLFFSVAFFSAVFISRAYAKKGTEGLFPTKPILMSALVLTVLQLSSVLVICVQFFVEYDDVTVTEMTQMAGDILYVIFRYGVILFGAVCLYYVLADEKTKKKRTKEQKTGDKRNII